MSNLEKMLKAEDEGPIEKVLPEGYFIPDRKDTDPGGIAKLTTTQVLLNLTRIQTQLQRMQKAFQGIPEASMPKLVDELLEDIEDSCVIVKLTCQKLRLGNR